MKSTGQASPSVAKSFRPTSKALWTFFLVFSLVPFVLRLGIEGRATQHQSFMAVYRNFRWSAPMAQLPPGSEIIWERAKEKDIYQDFFKNELQKEFKIVELGQRPRVRAFFEESAYLRARFEFLEAGSQTSHSFSDETRMTNNGILLGLWLGILLYLLGRSLNFSLFMTIVVTAFWYTHWNILALPLEVWSFFKPIYRELLLRIRMGSLFADWDYSRALEVLGIVWGLTVGAVLALLPRARAQYRKKFRVFLLSSLVWEPIFLWTSSYFANWNTDAHWWKVYLGSFAFRFLFLALVFFGLLQKDFWDIRAKIEAHQMGARFSRAALLFPLFFLMCGGWFWVNSLFPLDSGSTLLRLKAFLVSFLIAFFMGSRVFALGVSILLVSLHLPPTKGHWESAHIFGFVFDASLLGYILSPAKGFHPVLPPLSASHRTFMNVILMAYVLGVFLSAVGVPFLVCWMGIFLAVWTYYQITHVEEKTLRV